MKYSSILLLVLSLFFASAEAATIKKLKGSKALVALDGTEMKINDQFFSLNAAGKKRSVLRITNIKGDQATAEVVKGLPEVGQTLLAVPAGSSKKATSSDQGKMAGSTSSHSGFSNMGVLGSYLMNSMSVKFTVSGTDYTTKMKGTGFGVLGYYDYQYTHALQFRGAGGYEQFQVSEACTGLASCDANISYLSGYGTAKYNFINGATKVWAGGGLGLLWALSKSSTVLDSSLITSNYTITLNGGVDFDMGKGRYLPVVIDYSMFPSSSTVTASFIALRVGWGWR